MPRRSRKQLAIDRCVIAFLREYRHDSKVGSELEGAYYWNEREIQWQLFSHLRNRTVSRSIGSEWWIHAEGAVQRPKYARWSGLKHADVVVIDHSEFRRWWTQGQHGSPPAYETMIELKVGWTGYGVKTTQSEIKKDLRKLAKCLDDGKTKEGHLVLLDALGRDNLPYYSSDFIRDLLGRIKLRRHRLASRLHLWHWPDSEEPITNLQQTNWNHYTAASA